MPAETGALLLGAGFSRRYGARDKRMEPLSGSSVASTTLRTYSQIFDHVAVVIREDDDLLAEHLADTQAELIRTDQAHLGMGHTLAAGARYAQQASWAFACVGLMDMPFIKAASLLELQDASTNLAPNFQAIRFLDPHSQQPGPTPQPAGLCTGR